MGIVWKTYFLPLEKKEIMVELQPELVWAEVLKELVKTMPSSTFSTWVRPLKVSSIEEVGADCAIITLSASTLYVAQQAELRCYVQLKQIIDKTTSRNCDLIFRGGEGEPTPSVAPPQISGFTPQPIQNTHPTPPPRQAQPGSARPLSLFSSEVIQIPTVNRYKLSVQKARLREDFTFDTLAVSSSNQMAFAAAQTVAEQPGKAYSPLFIWGGVGVGKTHLMHAIGNSILQNNPDHIVHYCMGEEFLNEIITAIRSKKTLEFKNKYRQLQVLLIDDIQFIAGKDTAQEEFFHTFQAITNNGGQIVMTSDRPPHEIHPLEDRLRSRFEGGLTVDIQQPTFELRTAVVIIKAQKLALEIPIEIAKMIAATVESTRKIEGVVFAIHNAHRHQNKEITEALVKEILGQETRPVLRSNLKPSSIIKAVTNHYHVSINTLKGESRKKEYVTARHIAMYLLKSELDIPFAEIGATFGGRDHTSIMHAVSKIEREVKENTRIQQDISAIRVSLAH